MHHKIILILFFYKYLYILMISSVHKILYREKEPRYFIFIIFRYKKKPNNKICICQLINTRFLSEGIFFLFYYYFRISFYYFVLLLLFLEATILWERERHKNKAQIISEKIRLLLLLLNTKYDTTTTFSFFFLCKILILLYLYFKIFQFYDNFYFILIFRFYFLQKKLKYT